ncbi:MAG TPA: formate dehydrogenase [Usitatibacter sp.]|nr:formate dehydrogenase [Usitatibacter sp.]
MKTRPTSRRNFLLAAGLGSAGAVAAVATARKGTAPAGQKQASAADTAEGYRVTDHIQKYYKTTEV